MLNTFYFVHCILTILISIQTTCGTEQRNFEPGSAFSVFVSSLPTTSISSVLVSYPKDLKRSMKTDINDKEQLIVRVRISASSRVKSLEKYLIINDVYDPKRQSRSRAMIPYLFEVVRGEPVLMYPLIFIKDTMYSNTIPGDVKKIKENESAKPMKSNEFTSPALKDDQIDETFKEVVQKIFQIPWRKAVTSFEKEKRNTYINKVKDDHLEVDHDKGRNVKNYFGIGRAALDNSQHELSPVSQAYKTKENIYINSDRSDLRKRTYPGTRSLIQMESTNVEEARKRRMLNTQSVVDHRNRPFITEPKNLPWSGERICSNNIKLLHKRTNDISRKKRNSPYFDEKSSKHLGNSQHCDIDIESCDTCGGKGKKPNKPPCNDYSMANLGKEVKGRLYTKRGEENTLKKHAYLGNENGCLCQTSPNAKCICQSIRHSRSQYDAWFSVFNISEPQPFITTQIRIFRKQRGSWWEISPSTRLNSLSGAYSDGNISISFSSPIDILQMEKAMRFEDHQLLVPKKNTVERSLRKSLKQFQENGLPNVQMLNSNPNEIYTTRLHEGMSERSLDKMHSITDFGFFPSTVKVIDKCPLDDHHLCLNMLNDQTPGCAIKVKMPFKQNMLIDKNAIKVQISNILTDATTKDVLQVSVLVANHGIQSRAFELNISNCPTPSIVGAKTCVKRLLAPNIGETFTFLLPLIPDANTKHKKFDCNVVVLTKMSPNAKGKLIASRKLVVEPGKRCICVWTCSCHCIPKLETHVDYNICQTMSDSEKKQAGFLLDNKLDNKDIKSSDKVKAKVKSLNLMEHNFTSLIPVIVGVSLLVVSPLLLGFLKAIFGTCSKRIDQCAYDYLYSPPPYDKSSRCQRFLGNLFMFIRLPFHYLCGCCRPATEDLSVASSEWQCCLDSEESDSCTQLKPKKKKLGIKKRSNIESKKKQLANQLNQLSSSYYQDLTDVEACERPTKMSAKSIVQSLSEKRELRRKSNKVLPGNDKSEKETPPSKFVQGLLDAKRVYRTFLEPIGNVCQIPCGIKYCVQGYFLPVTGSMYEFVNFQPLVQYRGLSCDGKTVKELHPPIFLASGAFNRKYTSESDVIKSSDLFLEPPKGVPCINTRARDYSESSECPT